MLGKPIPMPIPNYGYLVHVKDRDLPDNILLHCLRLFMLRVSFCWVLLVGIYLLAHEELLKSFDNVGQANHC